MARFESTVQFAVNAQTNNVAVLDDFRKRVDGIGRSAQQSTGGIGALTSGIAGMSRGLATLGIGVSVAGLLGLGKSAVDLAGKLNDASAATTVAANKSIAEASSGNAEAARAFANLGIALRNQDGSIRATSDVFEELAQKIRAAPNDAAIFEQGTKILGRGFSSLLPLLEEGDEGMRKFQSRFSEEGIKNLDDFGDKLNRLGEAFKGMAASVTEVTVSGLLESVEFLNNTIGETLRNAGLLEKERQKINYTPTFGKAPINNPQMSTVDGLMSPIPGEMQRQDLRL